MLRTLWHCNSHRLADHCSVSLRNGRPNRQIRNKYIQPFQSSNCAKLLLGNTYSGSIRIRPQCSKSDLKEVSAGVKSPQKDLWSSAFMVSHLRL